MGQHRRALPASARRPAVRHSEPRLGSLGLAHETRARAGSASYSVYRIVLGFPTSKGETLSLAAIKRGHNPYPSMPAEDIS